MTRNSLSAWLGGVIIATASLQINAAGLGSLEVKSVLGEPLRAQVSVSATPAEVPSLKARLASPSAYEAAGLVYTGIVTQLSITLKKDGGKPLLLITSATPINEPVVDLLLELTWSSGRVTREYTAFIDPPFIAAERERSRAEQAIAEAEYVEKEQGAETSAANLPEAPTPQPLPAEGGEQAGPATAGETTAQAAAQPAPLEEEVEVTEIGPVETIGGTSPTLFDAEPSVSAPITAEAPMQMPAPAAGKPIGVIRGDTLSKIALANKPAGVTLEQMLVVLFRNNPTAFSGKNMNRLRTGKIVRLADADEYRSVTQSQALKDVRIQYRDWNAYRERVAVAAAQKMGVVEQPAQQAAAGTVTPMVEGGAPTPTEKASEVVKLSKGEPVSAGQAGAAQGNAQALQEKLVASEKALQESNARVARLEKIIEDLQKLAEVKSEDLAQLQSQAASTQGAATSQPKPAPAAKPEASEMKAAAEAAVAGTPTPEKPAAPEGGQPAPAPATTAGTATTAQAPTPAPAAPSGEAAKAPTPATQKPKRRLPPPPPPPPPSLLDRLLAEPYLLAIPLVVLLLIGVGVSRLRGRKREPKSGSEEVAPAKSRKAAAAAGAFAATDTDVGLASTRTGDGSEEVDPLEEAEIFLAYGRDAQAEELLKEAVQTHPTRFEVHAKLLEIYAKRRDQEAFESLAKHVQQGTGGHGEIWDRVVRLGYSIDPDNPRYAEGKSDDAEAFDARASQPENITSTVDRLDFEVGLDGSDESGAAPDFDPSAASEYESSPIVDPEATMEGSIGEDAPTMKIDMGDAGLTATDLDLNAELPMLDSDEAPESADTNALEFESSGFETPSVPEPSTVTQDSGLDFNMEGLSLDSEDEEQTRDMGEEAASEMPALDLSGISLDLDGATSTQTGSAGKDEKWYEVQTKFDLAKAYQEMGDKDGAKEILQEVISEGDSEQKAAAESVLASLG